MAPVIAESYISPDDPRLDTPPPPPADAWHGLEHNPDDLTRWRVRADLRAELRADQRMMAARLEACGKWSWLNSTVACGQMCVPQYACGHHELHVAMTRCRHSWLCMPCSGGKGRSYTLRLQNPDLYSMLVAEGGTRVTLTMRFDEVDSTPIAQHQRTLLLKPAVQTLIKELGEQRKVRIIPFNAFWSVMFSPRENFIQASIIIQGPAPDRAWLGKRWRALAGSQATVSYSVYGQKEAEEQVQRTMSGMENVLMYATPDERIEYAELFYRQRLYFAYGGFRAPGKDEDEEPDAFTMEDGEAVAVLDDPNAPVCTKCGNHAVKVEGQKPDLQANFLKTYDRVVFNTRKHAAPRTNYIQVTTYEAFIHDHPEHSST